jgi:hypothetical protein
VQSALLHDHSPLSTTMHRTGLNEDEVLLGEGEGEDDSDAPNTDDEDSNGTCNNDAS